MRHQDFDHTAHPPDRLGRLQKTAQQRDCRINGTRLRIVSVLGDQRPGQRHMLELGHIAEIVIGRQAALARPGQGLAPPAQPEVHPRLQRINGLDVRRRRLEVQTPRLIEQIQRGLQIPFGRSHPRLRHSPAAGPVRQRLLTQFGGLAQIRG